MKTLFATGHRKFASPAAHWVSVLGATLLTVVTAQLTVAAETIVVDTTPAASEGTTNTLLNAAIPVAAFENIPTQGKDPFFPNSTRRAPAVVKPLTPAIVQIAPVSDASQLTLRGISGSANKRIALINNLTFIAGESGKVRVPTGLLKLRVIEVKDSSAVIQLDGENVPRELKLRDSVLEKHPVVTPATTRAISSDP